MQQYAVFILFHCNIPLHVSDVFCIHHQEYVNTVVSTTGTSHVSRDVIGKIRYKVSQVVQVPTSTWRY
jgi:hypothetical protein